MRMLHTRMAWLACTVALALAAACSDDPATEDAATATSGSGASGSGASGGEGGGGAACDWGCGGCGTCVTAACDDELTECDADPECAAWSACVLACPSTDDGDVDGSCIAACPGAQASAGQAAIAGVETCRAAATPTCDACGATPVECGYEEPLLCQECGTSQETNPCFVCEDERCCDSYAASKANTAQPALSECLGGCETAPEPKSCEYECAVAHPEALTTFAPLVACMKTHCAMEQDDCDESGRDECQVCLWETCGDTYVQFTGNPEGFLLQACILHCAINDTACDNTCYDAYPAAKALFDVWGQCVAQTCTC